MFGLLLINKIIVMITMEQLSQKLNKIRSEIIKFQNDCTHNKRQLTAENNHIEWVCNRCQKVTTLLSDYKY